LRRVRRRKLPSRSVVITADVQPAVRRRCIAAGAHAFVEKPISLAKLRAALGETPPLA
jgi:CheY-like chemotaxis protein